MKKYNINKKEDEDYNILFIGQQVRKFRNKRELFKPIINKYLLKEFNDNIEFYLKNMNSTDKERYKYIYEISILLVLFSLNSFPYVILKNDISNFYKYFYEESQTKIINLKGILSFIKAKLYDEEQEININNNTILHNKNYKIKFNEHEEIQFNPFDYVLEFLAHDLRDNNYKDFLYRINKTTYWSIQKCALCSKIFQLEKTNNLFNSFFDKIINHNVIKKAFRQLKVFNEKEYLYNYDELKEQINSNNNRFYNKFDPEDNIVVRFIKKLTDVTFIIISLIHEIIFHYFLVILYSNDHLYLKSLSSPYNDFIIDINEYKGNDGGERGEILIFGQKLNYLYLNGLYKFLSMELWDRYKDIENIDFKKLGDEFLDINSENNNELKYINFVEINDFTKQLNEEIKYESEFEKIEQNILNNKIDNKTTLSNFFARGRIFSIENEIGDEDDEDD